MNNKMGSKQSKRRRVSVDNAWRIIYVPKAAGRKGVKGALKLHKPRRYSIYETPEFFVIAIGRPPADLANGFTDG